jgi:hypothetical protein
MNNGLESALACRLAANRMENGGDNSEDSLLRRAAQPEGLASQAELGRPKESHRFDLIAKTKTIVLFELANRLQENTCTKMAN